MDNIINLELSAVLNLKKAVMKNPKSMVNSYRILKKYNLLSSHVKSLYITTYNGRLYSLTDGYMNGKQGKNLPNGYSNNGYISKNYFINDILFNIINNLKLLSNNYID